MMKPAAVVFEGSVLKLSFGKLGIGTSGEERFGCFVL